MEKAKRSKRKSELFSVSFKPEDLEELEKFLGKQKADNGVALSRNELIRRAMLAHVRTIGQDEKSYKEIFKDIS